MSQPNRKPSGAAPSDAESVVARLQRSNRRLRALCMALTCALSASLLGYGVLRAAPQQQQPELKLDEPQNQAQTKLDVDDTGLIPSYCNFARVSGTPEEVILDYGMNPQPFNAAPSRIRINQKVVMSFYTAKRFAAALVLAIQRHEKAYGAIELDVRKRLQNQQNKDRRAEPET